MPRGVRSDGSRQSISIGFGTILIPWPITTIVPLCVWLMTLELMSRLASRTSPGDRTKSLIF